MVPDAISAWKPEIAPQAIVMKQNGKSLPAKTGPLPSMKRVSAGMLHRRLHQQDADGEQRASTPTLMKAER